MKYLGIVVDKNLKWDKHVLSLTNSIRKLIPKFYIIRNILNKKLLITVYKAIVESLLRYGLLIWGGLYQNALTPLNVVQNYILKVMFHKNRMYSTKNLYSSDILNVRSLYILSTCCYVYKSSEMKNYIAHIYSTRGRDEKRLVIPQSNTTRQQRSIKSLAPKIYNILPSDIRSTPSYRQFKTTCTLFISGNESVFRALF